MAARSGDVLLSEQGRLDTFRTWPHSAAVAPDQLAASGFYYLGQADRVRCVFCGGTLKSWQHGDNPATEHRKYFNHCDFIQGRSVANIPLRPDPKSMASVSEHCQPSSLNGLDIGPEVVPSNLRLNPRHPEYQSTESRRGTFVGWPFPHIQQPEALVEAGLFYTGMNDYVRCFCCDGSLRNWEASDDPWHEHARWFPRCPYVLQQKGQLFTQSIHENLHPQSSQNCSRSPVIVRKGGGAGEEALRQLQDMGFEASMVRDVQHRLRLSAGREPTTDDLMTAVLAETGSPRLEEATPRQGAESAYAPPAGGRASLTRQVSVDRTLCKVCMDREVGVTFMPCGHLSCCVDCARHIKECPMCRQKVKASIRTYLC